MIKKALLFILQLTVYQLTAQENEDLRRAVEIITSGQQATIQHEVMCKKILPEVYYNRAFTPIWNKPEQVRELISVLSEAPEEGLRSNDYHYTFLSQVDPESPGLEAELLLTDAYLLYASHILSGKVNPETLDVQWHASRREADLAAHLEEALTTGIRGSLDKLKPAHPDYNLLKKNLERYRQTAYDGGWPEVTIPETLKPGMTDPSIATIRERLAASGDLPVADPQNLTYDESLEIAVKTFQKRHGLTADGAIGKGTVEAMNIPIAIRIRQITLNMERFRWLPQHLGNHYILVNIASYDLQVIKNNHLMLEMDVVVGKPYRKTPVFSQNMLYLVLNPYWTVPPTILSQDVIPAVRRNSNYLRSLNMRVLQGYGNSEKEIDPATIDWHSLNPARFPYQIRQDPGPNNALGEVKFIFPNKYNVYMHDTNHRELFVKTDRALSSGCIRVSQPRALTMYLLNAQSTEWSEERLEKTLGNSKNHTVMLREPVMVHLLYWTAFADRQGALHFKKDIYERDKILWEALTAPPIALK